MSKRTLHEPSIQYEANNAITHGAMVPKRVVLHDTESHDTKGITDVAGIYNFWQRQGLGYGAHLVIDKDGNTGISAYGFEKEMYHVGNYNTGSIGIEQIGFASFTKLIWSRQHQKQLIKVARWLAWLHHLYGISLTHSLQGVCTHADVGIAGIDPSGHRDPGPNYPIRTVLWLANRYVRRGGWSAEFPI